MLQTRHLVLCPLAGALFVGGTSTRAAAQSDDQPVRYHSHWSEPAVIDSRGPGRGPFASFGEFYSELNGRKMWMQEFLAGAGITDTISLYIGRQDYLLHGHTSESRFFLQDNLYGGKWVIKQAKKERDTSMAAEFQIVIPGSANASVGNSSETFYATKNQSAAFDFGPGRGWESQLSLSGVKGAGLGYGNVYALGVGKEISLGSAAVRLQGQLIDDNTTGTDGIHNADAIRPVFYAAIGYNATEWLRLEADGTLFTSGMPLAGTEFTGLSSFQVYNPGGAAANLRTDVVGIASARILFHWKF